MAKEKKIEKAVEFAVDTVRLAFRAFGQGQAVEQAELGFKTAKQAYVETCAAIRQAVKPADWPAYCKAVLLVFQADNPKAGKSEKRQLVQGLSYLRKKCGYPAGPQAPINRRPKAKPDAGSDAGSDGGTDTPPEIPTSHKAKVKIVMQSIEALAVNLGTTPPQACAFAWGLYKDQAEREMRE